MTTTPAAADTPAFTFTATLPYTDWRGRERECECTVSYTYDGKGKPHCTRAIAHSSAWAADYALECVVDDWIAERCEDDFADWLDDQDQEIAG